MREEKIQFAVDCFEQVLRDASREGFKSFVVQVNIAQGGLMNIDLTPQKKRYNPRQLLGSTLDQADTSYPT